MTVRPDSEYTWDPPTAIVDELLPEFKPFVIENEETHMPYRLFIPKIEAEEGQVPLVIYLHGAGEIGDDGVKPFEHDAAVEFARKDWQEKHPCFVLVPQCIPGKAWKMKEEIQLLHDLIQKILAENVGIDPGRVYLYGCSMGCMGSLEYLKTYPGEIAASLLICGGTEAKGLEGLMVTPMWFFHAVDDASVTPGIREMEAFGVKGLFYGSRALYEKLKQMGKIDVRYTEYEAEFIHEKYGYKSHCAWLPALESEEVREWLFHW